MKRDEIEAGLKDLLQRQNKLKLPPESIRPETRIDQVGFDSLSILDFIYDVEDRFGVQTQMSDLVQMERVGDLIGYLEQRLPG